jgi:hypothetical protein
MTDPDNLPRHRSSRPPLPDALGKLCVEGKSTAQYLWQVPDDPDARAKIVTILNQIAVEAQKQNRKEMGRAVAELLTAAKASPSPQQVDLLVGGFDRLTKLWQAAKSGL